MDNRHTLTIMFITRSTRGYKEFESRLKQTLLSVKSP